MDGVASRTAGRTSLGAARGAVCAARDIVAWLSSHIP